MPSLEFRINSEIPEAKRERIVHKIEERFHELPPSIKDDAVLAFPPCRVVHGKKARPYWLVVRCSKGTPPETVVEIANLFLPVTDAEVYNPEAGYFRFRPKGSSIKVEDL